MTDEKTKHKIYSLSITNKRLQEKLDKIKSDPTKNFSATCEKILADELL